jgi:hypothetical protein
MAQQPRKEAGQAESAEGVVVVGLSRLIEAVSLVLQESSRIKPNQTKSNLLAGLSPDSLRRRLCEKVLWRWDFLRLIGAISVVLRESSRIKVNQTKSNQGGLGD